MDNFMNAVGKVLHSVWQSVQPWAQRNVTFGLVLAIVTEVPRWTFAFAAAHEPIWAGCALAALMSYAAAHAWEEYFTRHDKLLLLLNGLSLGFGVFTISPVIFAMTSGGGHSVQITSILPTGLLWAWSIVLASTTFLPLIQVAVVEVRRRERMQSDAQPKVKRIVQPQSETVQPATPIVQASVQPVDDDAQPICTDDRLDGAPDPTDKEAYAKWLHMEKGMTQTALAAQFGVHRNTIRTWLNGTVKASVQ